MKYVTVITALLAAACLAAPAWAGQPAYLQTGSHGPAVGRLQAYLHANQQADYYAGPLDGSFGPMTRAGLTGWQKAAGFRPTGRIAIGSGQWNRLRRQATVTRLPGYISQVAIAAARQTGWAVDASKAPSTVTVLHYQNGTVQVALGIAAAYAGTIGGSTYTTANGIFRIYFKAGPDFVSRLYNNAPMPWAACFNGGQCLHYDGLFPSHGCIHIPSMAAAKYIHDLPYGTTVVVHE